MAKLLGPTRAACLHVIAEGCTGELARRTHTTAPTASHHASTLRDPGLTTSNHLGNLTLGTLTQPGRALLDQTACV